MILFGTDGIRARYGDFPLDDSTIVHPGHRPMTTIGEEKSHNPFLNSDHRGRGAWL